MWCPTLATAVPDISTSFAANIGVWINIKFKCEWILVTGSFWRERKKNRVILIKIMPLSLRSIIKAIVIRFYLWGNVQQRTYDVISVNEFQIDPFKLNQEWKSKGKKIRKQSRHSKEQKVALFLLLSEHSHARIHSHQSYRICISVRNEAAVW